MASARRRWLSALGIVLVLALIGVGGMAYSVISRVTGDPHPEPARVHEGAPDSYETPEAFEENSARIRVRVLEVGETLVTFGQFFSGLEGWVGGASLWRAATDSRRWWAPVTVVVIEHPERGIVLVDAGLSEPQTDAFWYYSVFEGGLNAGMWRDGDNRINPGRGLIGQLRSLGIGVEDVTDIVITHLHEDHLGEVATFPNATIHVSKLEWEDRARVSYEPTFAKVGRWNQFEYDDGSFDPFSASYDLTGDGTILLLPTPGHTMGHTSVLISQGEGNTIVTGDALYTLRHLDPEAVASLNYFGTDGLATYQDSVRRIADLQQELGDLIIVPSHEPFAYKRLLSRAYADGRVVDEERDELLDYQQTLYDDVGSLLPEATPRYDDAAEAVITEIQ